MLIQLLLDKNFPYGDQAFASDTFHISSAPKYQFLPASLSHFTHVIHLYVCAFQADIVLGNRRTVLLLGLLSYLYKPKKLAIVGYEMVFNFKDTLRHRGSMLLWRIAVRNIDLLITQSQEEISEIANQLNTTKDTFKSIPFFSDAHPYIGPTPDGHVFAAGRMERDFVTLLKAMKGLNYPLVIVAEASQKTTLEKYKTSYTRFYFDIPKTQYLSLLQKARLVVLCLKRGDSARGQVVLMEAMSMGKPAICSDVVGIKEYIQHQKTGWLVEAESVDKLSMKLQQHFLNMEGLQKIGKSAFQQQRDSFSAKVFFENYEQTLIELWNIKHGVSTPSMVNHDSIHFPFRPKV